jgi:hypothetical protein
MKKLAITILVCLLGAGCLFAQTEKTKKKSKFGSFLKKAVEATTDINVSNEFFVVNNLPGYTVAFKSCIGDPTAQTVTLTFVLKHNKENQSINLKDAQGYDQEGNTYEGYPNERLFDLPTGIPLKITYVFSGVLPAVTQMELLKVKIWFNGANTSADIKDIEFRNVPIDWNPGQTPIEQGDAG